MTIAIVLAVLAAYVVKGMSGFANTLVFGTIMSFKTNTINITPLELVVGYPANIFIAWKARRGIVAKVWLPLAVLVILGSIPGAFFLKNGDAQLIKALFGFSVVFIGVEMFLRERQPVKRQSSGIMLAVIGVISGILCGLFGIGAFLVAYISRTTQDRNQFLGNICMVFLVENTFRIGLYMATGILNMQILKTALLLMPVMAAGLWIGIQISKRVGEGSSKKIIILLLIFSGLSLIVNNLK